MRRSLYWLLFIGGLAIAAMRGALAIHWLREWQRWRIADPSAAELYEVNLWFEIGWTAIALVFAVTGLVLIRKQPSPAKPEPPQRVKKLNHGKHGAHHTINRGHGFLKKSAVSSRSFP